MSCCGVSAGHHEPQLEPQHLQQRHHPAEALHTRPAGTPRGPCLPGPRQPQPAQQPPVRHHRLGTCQPQLYVRRSFGGAARGHCPSGGSCGARLCLGAPWRPAITRADVTVSLLCSPSPGAAPAAGDAAPHPPEPVHAVLGQPHHQRHALRRRSGSLLLPGTQPGCTARRVAEGGTWGLSSTEVEI